jgi:hypothetical protein
MGGKTMKHSPQIALVLSVFFIAGCKPAHDPAKWYLTGYENGKLLIQHDHRLYTAHCFESFGAGRTTPDSTPQCSDMLEIPGIGHEIPLKHGQDISWLAMADFAYFTPAGDQGPQYHLIFDSIKENGQ